jgi:hypothetical protein
LTAAGTGLNFFLHAQLIKKVDFCPFITNAEAKNAFSGCCCPIFLQYFNAIIISFYTLAKVLLHSEERIKEGNIRNRKTLLF